MVSSWRIEAILQLVSYLAAAVLAVILPLHLLEHVPFGDIRQPPRPWVLWLLLVFAGIHGSLGLRVILSERLTGRSARLIAAAASLLLGIIVILAGAVGLARVYGFSWG